MTLRILPPPLTGEPRSKLTMMNIKQQNFGLAYKLQSRILIYQNKTIRCIILHF